MTPFRAAIGEPYTQAITDQRLVDKVVRVLRSVRTFDQYPSTFRYLDLAIKRAQIGFTKDLLYGLRNDLWVKWQSHLAVKKVRRGLH